MNDETITLLIINILIEDPRGENIVLQHNSD